MLLILAACGDAPDPGGGLAETSPEAPRTPIRRLTEEQYENTVRDLFPGAVLPDVDLPRDVEVFGFDNNADGQAPSALVVEGFERAAIAVTAAALADPSGWSICPADGGPSPQACGRDQLRALGPRIFRRPLTDEEESTFLGFFDDVYVDDGYRVALSVTLQALLQSPEFVYLPEHGVGGGERIALTGYEVATRLSYALWASTPDAQLLGAAAAGDLADADGIEAQAWRMLDDPRADRAVLDFHAQWLDLADLALVAPDPGTYPAWDPSLPDAMGGELDAFVLDVLRGDDPTLSALLLDRGTVAEGPLAALYGIDGGELPADERAGLLTRAGWLAATSHPVHPSPVQRGVFVLERLLCVELAPPPPGVADVAPLSAVTNRERYAAHTADPACASCHAQIDPLGFAFENYDAVGAFRETDAGQPVDATGVLEGRAFDGALELSELLAGSRTVSDCVAREWARYAHGRTLEAGDDAEVRAVGEGFAAAGGDLRQLLVEIVRSEGFRTRSAP